MLNDEMTVLFAIGFDWVDSFPLKMDHRDTVPTFAYWFCPTH